MADELPLRDQIAEFNSEALFCDGYDHALVGVAERFGMNPVAAYDYDKIIQTLVDGGCSHEEAVEFFEFNIVGAWMGENTPVFIRPLFAEKLPAKFQKSSS